MIDTSDGLANDELYTLGETSDGALLVTGAGGLSVVRYDRKGTRPQIRNYTVKEGLVGSYALAIAVDPDGRCWVGSDQGLAMIDGNVVQQYTTQDGLPINEVNAIHIATGSLMWLKQHLSPNQTKLILI